MQKRCEGSSTGVPALTPHAGMSTFAHRVGESMALRRGEPKGQTKESPGVNPSNTSREMTVPLQAPDWSYLLFSHVMVY